MKAINASLCPKFNDDDDVDFRWNDDDVETVFLQNESIHLDEIVLDLHRFLHF
jgi:hypothetical protein